MPYDRIDMNIQLYAISTEINCVIFVQVLIQTQKNTIQIQSKWKKKRIVVL